MVSDFPGARRNMTLNPPLLHPPFQRVLELFADTGARKRGPELAAFLTREREFFIDNLLVRVHFIIVMIKWTGLAPWEFEFLFPGSLTSTFLVFPRNARRAFCGHLQQAGAAVRPWCEASGQLGQDEPASG